MNEEVWYRPKGTIRSPGAPPTRGDLWYRLGSDGYPECTVRGQEDWSETLRSREYGSMEEIRNSPLVIRVYGVGKRIPFDPDLAVDEGL